MQNDLDIITEKLHEYYIVAWREFIAPRPDTVSIGIRFAPDGYLCNINHADGVGPNDMHYGAPAATGNSHPIIACLDTNKGCHILYSSVDDAIKNCLELNFDSDIGTIYKWVYRQLINNGFKPKIPRDHTGLVRHFIITADNNCKLAIANGIIRISFQESKLLQSAMIPTMAEFDLNDPASLKQFTDYLESISL